MLSSMAKHASIKQSIRIEKGGGGGGELIARSWSDTILKVSVYGIAWKGED